MDALYHKISLGGIFLGTHSGSADLEDKIKSCGVYTHVI